MKTKVLGREGIEEAARLIIEGQIVGMPTETVYGLAGNALNVSAIAQIFALKGRPQNNPLIVHCASLQEALTFGQFTDKARALAERFWPGALTLVVPSTGGIPKQASAGLDTVALRVPSHQLAVEVLKRSGVPIVAPSANLSGRPSPTTAQHVFESFAGKIPLILDGGASEVGLESTVVDVRERVRVLRYGKILPQEIEAVVGCPVEIAVKAENGVAHSPGQMFRHYAPRAPLFINQETAFEGEVFLAFGNAPPLPEGVTVFSLSVTGDVEEAARHFFALLRKADALSPKAIRVQTLPATGIGLALLDRLTRAAEG